eukprot:4398385-Ditylum_brightwellii.AAC.1
MLIPHQTNNKATRAVGLYQDVLQGYSNPQEETDANHVTTMDYNQDVNPIRPRKRASVTINAETSEINSIQQHNTITPASQLTSNISVNTIAQKDLMKQMQIFREEMVEANKRFFRQQEEELKQNLESLITIKIESIQRKLAAQFTKDLKTTMHLQQTDLNNTIKQQQEQQNEHTQASFQQQQTLFKASIQCLFEQLRLPHQGASSPINTAVATSGIEHSSTAGARDA